MEYLPLWHGVTMVLFKTEHSSKYDSYKKKKKKKKKKEKKKEIYISLKESPEVEMTLNLNQMN